MIKRKENLRENETYRLVKKAFIKLRKLGIVTRMNFMCCSSCAISALVSDYEESTKSIVFFNRQDTEHFLYNGILHIRYGVYINGFSISDLEWRKDIELGNTIVTTMLEEGLHVEWDGFPNSTIQVSERVS
jgi:hypothetical protein